VAPPEQNSWLRHGGLRVSSSTAAGCYDPRLTHVLFILHAAGQDFIQKEEQFQYAMLTGTPRETTR